MFKLTPKICVAGVSVLWDFWFGHLTVQEEVRLQQLVSHS